MAWDPGIGTETVSRDFRRFFRRYRNRSASMRSTLNYIQPVATVGDFKLDDVGSHFALTHETGSAAGQHPCLFFGTITEKVDVEILGLQLWYRWDTSPGSIVFNMMCHAFTPVAPYTPIATLDPVGAAVSGLITNEAFHRGSAYMVGGYAPAMPSYGGWTGWVFSRVARSTSGITLGAWYAVGFDGLMSAIPTEIPLRLYGNSGLAFQLENPSATAQLALACTLYYRERETE